MTDKDGEGTSANAVVAVARHAPVMPDHLDGGWCACVERRGKIVPCEVVDDGFGWLAGPVVYDDAGLALDDADAGWFFAVLCQRRRSVE